MRRVIYETDHRDFRDSFRGFLEREAAPLDDWRDAKGLPRDFWTAAGRAGLLGLEIPEEHGGHAARDYRFNAVMFEELARVSMALGSCVGIHADIVAPYLAHLGTAEQQRRWLPDMASGTLLGAIAMTEPSAGSDLAGIRTTAVRRGDTWVLNGSKTFITNGFSADLVIVAAKTSPDLGARGISLFVVERDAEGFTRGRKLDKVGQPESDTAELFFDDVSIPTSNLIVELDRGFVHLMDFLPQERIGCAVTNLAHARWVLDETVEHCRTRQAFGQPIGSFQHNKFLLAELVTRVEVAQSFLDQCVVAHTAGELTPVDAAKAKWWSADVQNAVLDHCVQLHGGYGYMTEYRVARAWQDARVTRIWAGSNEIMKEIIGRDLGL
ncbi:MULTISPECIES: acyl-CoA dehydrogenase family protein [unclassified Aeromicrobium]|uniref:acyl-CoA dehydrogenase family protein n=1 Tax=unclassified Aeromicrobium TaxID=2633570 RepID=UPI00396B3805